MEFIPREVSEKEHIFVYLFLTDILDKYVSGILFSQKLIFRVFIPQEESSCVLIMDAGLGKEHPWLMSVR